MVKRLSLTIAMNNYSPSLLLTLAKTGPWLLDSWEELLKDDDGRLDISGLSQTSVIQPQEKRQRWVFTLTVCFTGQTVQDFLWGVCMFSLCLCECCLGALVSSCSPKTFRLDGGKTPIHSSKTVSLKENWKYIEIKSLELCKWGTWCRMLCMVSKTRKSDI